MTSITVRPDITLAVDQEGKAPTQTGIDALFLALYIFSESKGANLVVMHVVI